MMKSLISFLLLFIEFSVFGTNLPEGVTVDSTECNLNNGKFSYSFFKNDEMIGIIEPGICHHQSMHEDVAVDSSILAEFYMSNTKDTFATSQEAIKWIISEMENYYKPEAVTKWKQLEVQPPKVSLEYPWEWTYRLEKYSIFDSKFQSENKLVLKDARGSEIVQIIRTPNTAKHSTQEIMDLSSFMNRSIDFKQNPAVDIIIDGKTFKTIEHTFMVQMLQRHYWYADDKEIIYIGYGLLKDQKLKYRDTIKHIMEKIKW